MKKVASTRKPFQPALTMPQLLGLFEDARAYANSEQNGTLSRDMYRVEAGKRLGFEVTKFHLKRVAVDIPIIRFNLGGGHPNNPITQLYNRVQKLEDALAKLEAKCNRCGT